MQTAETPTPASMIQVFPNLYQSVVHFPFEGDPFRTRACLLVRPQGNLLVYSSPHIARHAEFIRAHGGIQKQYLSHLDEASPGCDVARELFGAPMLCPETERKIIEKTCRVDATYSAEGMLEEGFEHITTHGHSPGHACFLWNSLDGRVLFVGDAINPACTGDWMLCLCSDKSAGAREQAAQALEKLRDVEFDVLVPSGSETDSFCIRLTRAEWRDAVEAKAYALRTATDVDESCDFAVF